MNDPIHSELTHIMPANNRPNAHQEGVEGILPQLMQVLSDLKDQGIIVRIRICPQCKWPTLRDRETYYDIGGAMGITPPKYRCLRCGYWSRVIIEATNEELDERILDDLIGSDIQTAQKLLKNLQEKQTKE